jgi:hypothetical protein
LTGFSPQPEIAAATLLRRQVAKALDELAEMFLRRMHKLH